MRLLPQVGTLYSAAAIRTTISLIVVATALTCVLVPVFIMNIQGSHGPFGLHQSKSVLSPSHDVSGSCIPPNSYQKQKTPTISIQEAPYPENHHSLELLV